MSRSAELRCRCGEVEGRIADASPSTSNRIICLCDDCQAYAHHLGRADLLDAHGGSDIVQIAPASLTFTKGVERIKGVRLKPNGLHRWYADCCKTPVGNTLKPSIPFIGVSTAAIVGGARAADDLFGPPRASILGKFAIGEPPPGSTSLSLGPLFLAIRRVLGWKLGGRVWPHPFFDRATGEPSHAITVLTPEERQALRPLCGPRAA